MIRDIKVSRIMKHQERPKEPQEEYYQLSTSDPDRNQHYDTPIIGDESGNDVANRFKAWVKLPDPSGTLDIDQIFQFNKMWRILATYTPPKPVKPGKARYRDITSDWQPAA